MHASYRFPIAWQFAYTDLLCASTSFFVWRPITSMSRSVSQMTLTQSQRVSMSSTLAGPVSAQLTNNIVRHGLLLHLFTGSDFTFWLMPCLTIKLPTFWWSGSQRNLTQNSVSVLRYTETHHRLFISTDSLLIAIGVFLCWYWCELHTFYISRSELQPLSCPV